jgi:single-stranded DNA-specific DHH superfamily exonuclease
MIKKYDNFITEEVGIRNITNIIADHKREHGNNFEIWFHQDLDGVTSASAMKSYLERYGMKCG